MELYIVRHGPAAQRNPKRWNNDDERPLTPNGARATRKAARGLSKIIDPVDRLFSSPAARARRTAEIVREEIEDPPEIELLEELEPGAPAPAILAKIHATARPRSRWIVVGHEPTLGELVGLSVMGEAVSPLRLTKGGMVELEFPREMVPGGARINWVLTRKQLVALAGAR
jgi:phosphohistidine phosphatase